MPNYIIAKECELIDAPLLYLASTKLSGPFWATSSNSAKRFDSVEEAQLALSLFAEELTIIIEDTDSGMTESIVSFLNSID